MQEITNFNLQNILNAILENNKEQTEEFKSGMNCIVQGLNDYMNAPPPPFILSNSFKDFALNKFLNNDIEKLSTFEKLIELFKIKMNQIGRYSTWDVYPEEMDDDVGAMLMECFDGIEILGYRTDFDRQGVTIDLNIYVKKEDSSEACLSISTYGNIEDDDFMPSKSEEDNEYDDREELEIYLNEECHYETLFLYVCLKKFYQYINPKKVKYLLETEKNI